ncbi:MAG: acyl-CoA dehydrogenase family protein [Robiginitomaculum sp.]|nr:acyl-CoA dehydrogenase family protein [Robiginitomaculum sp.]
MDFNLTTTDAERKFRFELGVFLDQELTTEICRQHSMDLGLGKEAREFALKLGKTGWLGRGWPERYGGSGGTVIDEYILVQEFARREAFVPNIVARFMCGPVMLRHGSEDMKSEFLPRIAGGEIEFSLGYTEPSSGSDLASMRMRAVDDGDSFVISGQKTFNTQSHFADYHWLAVRTDPDAPRHRGISLFVVDQRATGITISPIDTLGGERTNEVFYDEVRVPKTRLVGELNKGFYYMAEALGYERLMLFQSIRLVPSLNRIIAHTKVTSRGGDLLCNNPYVRRHLAQMATEIKVAQAMEDRAFALLKNGKPLDHEASLLKLFGSAMRQRFADHALDILGPTGRLENNASGDPLGGEIAKLAKMVVIDTIGGGTSEILKTVVATRGMGLPR